MNQNTSQSPIEISSKAEGDPEERERLEPPTHLRTSTIPAIRGTSQPSVSDTGVNFVINLGTESQDTDESQDASLTADEKTLKIQTDKDASKELMPAKLTKPVLIVEDTVELAEVIQATLEGMDIKSVHETHGKTGIEQLKDLNPEIVIMDIGLPDITGWKMLDHIKEHYTSTDQAMPAIIVITAYGDPANRLIGKLQNIHSYLIKPFTPDQVERVVGMAIRGEKPEDPTVGTSSAS
ncbi:MAG: response regulator [Chloroflexota bacterium]